MQKPEEKLEELVRRLRELAGENLESVILYGSAARGEYDASRSDLNILCTLKSLDAAELARLNPALVWWEKQQSETAPLFFRRNELRESADVFAIELFDMRENHRVLYGPDPLAGIEVPMNLHRVQVEHELRTLLLKLRQHLLRNATNPRHLQEVCARSASSLRALLRHFLIALGEEPPKQSEYVFARAAQLAGVRAENLQTGLAWRSGESGNDVVRRYGEHLNAISRVLEALERHAPKREWQRTAKHA